METGRPEAGQPGTGEPGTGGSEAGGMGSDEMGTDGMGTDGMAASGPATGPASLAGIYNYRRLGPRLATAGQPTAEQLAEVARAGFTRVVNLLPADAPSALPEEEAIVTRLGLAYVHLPVPWEHPTRQQWETFARERDAHGDEPVFVHCAANMRVSVFVALHHWTRGFWSRAQAWAAIREIWEPNPTWRAFLESILAEEAP